jgi:hypothetical protein
MKYFHFKLACFVYRLLWRSIYFISRIKESQL